MLFNLNEKKKHNKNRKTHPDRTIITQPSGGFFCAAKQFFEIRKAQNNKSEARRRYRRSVFGKSATISKTRKNCSTAKRGRLGKVEFINSKSSSGKTRRRLSSFHNFFLCFACAVLDFVAFSCEKPHKSSILDCALIKLYFLLRKTILYRRLPRGTKSAYKAAGVQVKREPEQRES